MVYLCLFYTQRLLCPRNSFKIPTISYYITLHPILHTVSPWHIFDLRCFVFATSPAFDDRPRNWSASGHNLHQFTTSTNFPWMSIHSLANFLWTSDLPMKFHAHAAWRGHLYLVWRDGRSHPGGGGNPMKSHEDLFTWYIILYYIYIYYVYYCIYIYIYILCILLCIYIYRWYDIISYNIDPGKPAAEVSQT